jgi:MFS family permease
MIHFPSLSKKLSGANPLLMSVFVAIMAFMTYSCMYAFRKPFAAATFAEEDWLGVDLKVWLILMQTLGYMASKFYGIKLIAELSGKKRGVLILVLIGLSWLALLGFAILPAPFNILCFLLNGFPLGLIWGLVFHYLEGRKFTEMMGSILAISFVFSSGFVKSIGRYLLDDLQIDPYWMPFVTGGLFIPFLILAVFFLDHTPPPTQGDILLKTQRKSMNKAERKAFFSKFSLGIVLLVLVYMALTAFRDIRDNFVVEIWKELKVEIEPELLTQTEIPVTLVLLLMMGLLVLVKNNYKALFLYHVIIISGLLLAVFSTLLLQSGWMNPFYWIVATGTGIYMAYIPFNCLLFDRLLAAFKYVGNVGFLMYLVDSFGYLGSFGILVFKQFGDWEAMSWLAFYSEGLILVMSLAVALMAFNGFYFYRKLKKHNDMIPVNLP